MRLTALLSCLAIALLMAGSAVATTGVTPDAGTGSSGDQKGGVHESLEDILRRDSEKPEAVSADIAAGSGGISREARRPDHQAPRDGMFLLFLQILRSPK